MWRVAVVLALLGTAACSDDPGGGAPAAGESIVVSTPAHDTGPDDTGPDDTGRDDTGRDDDPEPAASPETTDGGVDTELVTPEGFDRVRATVTTEGGERCELCLWLAETGDQRSRGLMFVSDLGPADGMAFVYPDPHTGNFWMKNTVLPLSIAFFDPSGEYVAAFDMEPCEADPCPLYRTPSNFLVAVETVQGELAELGIAPGSTLTIDDVSCD